MKSATKSLIDFYSEGVKYEAIKANIVVKLEAVTGSTVTFNCASINTKTIVIAPANTPAVTFLTGFLDVFSCSFIILWQI